MILKYEDEKVRKSCEYHRAKIHFVFGVNITLHLLQLPNIFPVFHHDISNSEKTGNVPLPPNYLKTPSMNISQSSPTSKKHVTHVLIFVEPRNKTNHRVKNPLQSFLPTCFSCGLRTIMLREPEGTRNHHCDVLTHNSFKLCVDLHVHP